MLAQAADANDKPRAGSLLTQMLLLLLLLLHPALLCPRLLPPLCPRLLPPRCTTSSRRWRPPESTSSWTSMPMRSCPSLSSPALRGARAGARASRYCYSSPHRRPSSTPHLITAKSSTPHLTSSPPHLTPHPSPHLNISTPPRLLICSPALPPLRPQALHGAFVGAYSRANSDMQAYFGYEADAPNSVVDPNGDNKANGAVSTRFNCPGFTLEMPFKDSGTNPSRDAPFDGARCKMLGRSLLDAVAYIAPQLSAADTPKPSFLLPDDVYVPPCEDMDQVTAFLKANGCINAEHL